MQNARIEPASNSKATRVRSMFSEIAPRYDLLNHVLSLGIDRRWRRFTCRKLEEVLSRPGATVLDLCCGTGDLLFELAPKAEACGLDFCHPMLLGAAKKSTSKTRTPTIVEGDALTTPFASEQFDAVTIAFGLRNLDSVRGGLAEIYRLLKPGGRAAILEFSKPVVPVFRNFFELYFRHVLPRIGGAVSGSSYAYRYLHDSVADFPNQQSLASLMRDVGFSDVTYYNLTGGIAALHLGSRAE